MRRLVFQFTLLALLSAAFGCRTNDQKAKAPGPSTTWNSPANSLTVMTYNVENLFDNKDDPRKADQTYLPLSAKQSAKHRAACESIKVGKWRAQCLEWDWSDQLIQAKLERLGAVIRSVRDGKGPDVLILQEVENIAILRRLVREQLKDLGYHDPILIEGRDLRGIDVAIVSRLKPVQPSRLSPITFKSISKAQREDTRGILSARLQLPDGKSLAVFAVHMPAPFHPTPLRIDALQELNRLAQKSGKGLKIAGGDFNITAEEDQKEHLLERFAQPHWLISHQIGCRGCRGSQYYPPKNSWSFLDMLWLSRDFYDGAGGWKVLPASVRLINSGHPEQTTADGYPKEFDATHISGVSDHWPVAVDIVPVN